MNCKRCHHAISREIAAETTRKIKDVAEAVGLSRFVIEALLAREAPLCRNCMKEWGTGEDDLIAP
jgi:hypothetical protein